MTLDAHTRRNLELFESGRGGNVRGSLLWVLDATRTPMGGRLLRKWIAEPLLDLRAAAPAAGGGGRGVAETLLRARLAPALAKVGDLERLTNRVLQRIATPRDLVALAQGRAARGGADSGCRGCRDVPAGLAPVIAQALRRSRSCRADRACAGG